MNNLTNDFINHQANQFAGAINDAFLEECNQFMIVFLDLPRTYVDGNDEEQKTGFHQSYAWSLDKGYLLQTHAVMTKEGLVQEMSMYQKKVSKFCKVKSTYNVESEPCEAPDVKEAVQQSEAVPYSGMNVQPPTTPVGTAAAIDIA